MQSAPSVDTIRIMSDTLQFVVRRGWESLDKLEEALIKLIMKSNINELYQTLQLVVAVARLSTN